MANPDRIKRPREPRLRRVPDPAGRVDILAIRLLERLVESHGDVAMRGVYGTYKTEIDRALRRHLGRFKLYIPPRTLPQGGQNAA